MSSPHLSRYPHFILWFSTQPVTVICLSLTSCNSFCQQELDTEDRQAETEDSHQNQEQQRRRDKEKDKDREKEQEREKQQLNQELNVLEEKAKRLRDGKDKSKPTHTYFLNW